MGLEPFSKACKDFMVSLFMNHVLLVYACGMWDVVWVGFYVHHNLHFLLDLHNNVCVASTNLR